VERLVRRRRSNVLSGLLITVGGVLVFLASGQEWIAITGPSISFAFFKDLVQVGVNPDFSQGEYGDLRQIMQVVAGGIVLAGVLLLVTRLRGLGVLWRLAALTLGVVPGVVFYAMWQSATASPVDALRDPHASVGTKIMSGLQGLFQRVGLVHIGPATGLYAGIAGLVCVAVGCFVPARRIDERVGGTYGARGSAATSPYPEY
jgi:hypothetical protein